MYPYTTKVKSGTWQEGIAKTKLETVALTLGAASKKRTKGL